LTNPWRRVWKYQQGKQDQYIKEQQKTQWPKDTKGVIIINISKNNRQRNGQKKKDKQRSTKHTYKAKDRVTRTLLKMICCHLWRQKGAIRSCKTSLKIPKGIIRISISKNNRRHNGQKKKDKKTNNDLQNIHIKLKFEVNTGLQHPLQIPKWQSKMDNPEKLEI
jgi:hypothetical protein